MIKLATSWLRRGLRSVLVGLSFIIMPAVAMPRRVSPERAHHPEPPTANADRSVLIPNATWEQYKQVQEMVETNGCGRVSLLWGWLEIMTVSKQHAELKKRLAHVIELYFMHLDIEYFAFGEATLEKMADETGRQPDESYCFNEKKVYPDLAIEIALTSGGLDKLEFYQQYGVTEVWIWENQKLQIYVLGDSGYGAQEKSGWFPELDLECFVECMGMPSMRDARKKFLASLVGNS